MAETIAKNFDHNQREVERVSGQIGEAIKLTCELLGDSRVFIFGSVARRIVAANTSTWDGVSSSILHGMVPPFRKNERRKYDIDIAVPADEATWERVAGVSATVMDQYPMIEVDPHLMELTSDGTHCISQVINRELAVFPLKFSSVKLTDSVNLQLPDLGTQLQYLLSASYFRAKDFSELFWFATRFMRSEVGNDELMSMLSLAIRNQEMWKISNIIRIPYALFVPISLRRELARRRGIGIGPPEHLSPLPKYL